MAILLLRPIRADSGPSERLPSRMQGAIASFFETSGYNYILVSFAWGSLTQAQSERSMELFATQVMPKFG